MINLSYKFQQNSASLEISGVPDVSNGDSDKTIGIITSWSLKIIGSPLLEGEKQHLENLMQVILQYSRSYISGIRNTYTSEKNIVKIYPFGTKHKLLLTSTQKNIKPLEITLDDSELSDLIRCIDLLRCDSRIKVKWNRYFEKPFTKNYIKNNLSKSNKEYNFIYASLIFILTSSLLILVPIDSNLEKDKDIKTSFFHSYKSSVN